MKKFLIIGALVVMTVGMGHTLHKIANPKAESEAVYESKIEVPTVAVKNNDGVWCRCTDWLAWEPTKPTTTKWYKLCGTQYGPSCMYEKDCPTCPVTGGPCCDNPE